MDAMKWDNILLEWVNCLKLTNAISTLNDLRNGEFYLSLLKLLNNQYNDEIAENAVTSIFNLLKQQYPAFIFDCENCSQLKDLTNKDLLAVTSLLMHYTCILDRRDCLITLMCQNLSNSLQLSIKSFLEKLNNNVTQENLLKVIEVSIEKEALSMTPRSYQWVAENSPLRKNASPLQDFLRTPSTRYSRYMEKDKEIKRLKSELELERFEKIDMQEELRMQQERLKKISFQLQEKTAEISKIRGDLFAIENKTPPHEISKDLMEIQRRYQIEIKNLEQYVSQLQTEQDELIKENDIVREKMRKTEINSKIWQEKCIIAENNNEALSEKYKLQEVEICNLRIQCTELNALLEELKSIKSFEESYIGDVVCEEVVKNSCEGLACALAVAELNDYKKENEDLKGLLKESLDKELQLNKDLDSVKVMLDDLNSNCLGIQKENQSLLSKLATMNELHESLESTKRELCEMSKSFSLSKLQNEDLNNDIFALNESMDKARCMLSEKDSLNKGLEKDLCEFHERYAKLENTLHTKNQQYGDLENERKILQEQYVATLNKFNKVTSELESVNQKYKAFDCDMEISLRKLEYLLLEENKIMNYENKVSAIENIIDRLVTNKLHDIDEKKDLNNRIVDFESLIGELQTEIATLTDKQLITLQEKDTLQFKMLSIDDHVKELETTIFDCTNKIIQLESTISELHTNISELEILKETINQKELSISELGDAKANLQEKLSQYEIDISDNITKESKMMESIQKLQEKLQKKISEIGSLQQNQKYSKEKMHQLETDKDSIKAALSLCKKQMHDAKIEKLRFEEEVHEKDKKQLEEINNSQLEAMSLKETIADLEENLELVRRDLQLKTSGLNKYKELNKDISEDCKRTERSLHQKIELVSDTRDKVQQELVIKTSEKQQLEDMLTDQIRKYEELQSDRNRIIEECETLNRNLNSELEKLVAKELEIADKNKTLVLYEKMLDDLKTDIEKKNESIEEMQHCIEQQNSSISGIECNIQELNTKNQELHQTIAELRQEIFVLDDVKEKLQLKSSHLEANTEMIIKELSIKNDALNKAVFKLKLYKESTESELAAQIKKYNDSQRQLEYNNNEHQSVIFEQDKQIKDLTDSIKNLNETIDRLNSSEIEYVQDLRLAKEEINDTVMKYTVALQTHQEIKIEYETQVNSLTESLHGIVKKYNSLEKEHSETLMNLTDVQKSVTSLEGIKVGLELKMSEEKVSQDKRYEAMQDKLDSEIKDLKTKQTVFEKEAAQLNEELTTSQEGNGDLQKEIDEITEKLKHVQAEKTELHKRHNTLEHRCNNIETDCLSFQTVQSELQLQIKNLHIEKQDSEIKQNELSEQIQQWKNEIAAMKQKYEEILTAKQDKIEECGLKLENYEIRLAKLTNERNNIDSILSSTKQEYDESMSTLQCRTEADKAKIHELEMKYMQVKSSYDIMEIGNKKVKGEVKELQKNLAAELLSKAKVEEQLRNEIGAKLDEISKLNEQLTYFEECREIKDQAIKMYQSELSTLKESVGNVSSVNKSLVEGMKHERESHEVKLKQTIETYECKLNTQELKLVELKSTYEDICQQLMHLKTDNSGLHHKIDEFLKEKCCLQEELVQKEALVASLATQKGEQDVNIKNLKLLLSENTKTLEEKLSQMEELESRKRQVALELIISNNELEKLKRNRDDILETQTKIIKETENNILRAHENAIEVKNDLMQRVHLAEGEHLKEREMRCTLENALAEEKKSKGILNIHVLELEREKNHLTHIYNVLKRHLCKLTNLVQEKSVVDGEAHEVDLDSLETLNTVISDIECRVTNILKKKRELSDIIQTLEEDKVQINFAMNQLKNEKDNLGKEKEKLILDFQVLQKEKASLLSEHELENKSLRDLEVEFEGLQSKYILVIESNKNKEQLLVQNTELRERLLEMNETNEKSFQNYEVLIRFSKMYKSKTEKVLSDRNVLEAIINKLRNNFTIVLEKTSQFNEYTHKQLFEQKQSLEIITEDIQKQFYRLSKQAYDMNTALMSLTEKCIEEILCSKSIDFESLFKNLMCQEIAEKLEDCKDRTTDALDQLEAYEAAVAKYNAKPIKTMKENVLVVQKSCDATQNGDIKLKEEEWKKKNTTLKQRLTLAENAKSNFEKKLKQLRDENKRLAEKSSNIDNDAHYKTLLQQHIQTKEDYERKIEEFNCKYSKLLAELENYKLASKLKPEKHCDYEHTSRLELELQKIREAYSNVMTENSKLDLENCTMKKILDERSQQLSNLNQIKEAYEKLLEDNNKLMMELDTIQFKRSRDRDEYVRLLEKEKKEAEARGHRKVQEVRSEYEGKLEKMKEKMIKLYKVEVDKEMQKVVAEKDENVFLQQTIDELKGDLKDAEVKIQKAEIERSKALEQLNAIKSQSTLKRGDQYSSRESVASVGSYRELARDRNSSRDSTASSHKLRNVHSASNLRDSLVRKTITEERKYSTMPRKVGGMDIIEEVRVARRTSINRAPADVVGESMVMEDEGELFNNKYLTDLKEGRCLVQQNNRASTSSRMSEFVWRNSLVPPHLKSSYPAETQFTSPTRFKDDDLKTGNLEFDDSMSSKLLPGEKPRKKDVGTTSYKKPGPPTPSKNAGRLSLQGNEAAAKEVLKEHNDSKTPKRTTPNRLKALFKGRNSSVRDTIENQPVTPRTKRLSIFRKPR